MISQKIIEISQQGKVTRTSKNAAALCFLTSVTCSVGRHEPMDKTTQERIKAAWASLPEDCRRDPATERGNPFGIHQETCARRLLEE